MTLRDIVSGSRDIPKLATVLVCVLRCVVISKAMFTTVQKCRHGELFVGIDEETGATQPVIPPQFTGADGGTTYKLS